jgi:hypothetical protein
MRHSPPRNTGTLYVGVHTSKYSCCGFAAIPLGIASFVPYKNFFLPAMPASTLLLDGCYTAPIEDAQEAYVAVRRQATGDRLSGESRGTTGRLFGLMCAGEQTASRRTEIMVGQMKPPDNWFRCRRLNLKGDESWNEIDINSLMRLHAPLPQRRSSQ